MTETATISARLRKLVWEQLEKTPDEVTEASSFVELGADSLDMVELVLATEDEFDIEISDAEAEGLKSVADAIALVERLLQAPVA